MRSIVVIPSQCASPLAAPMYPVVTLPVVETAGRLLHERLLAEARLAIGVLLSDPPATPEDAAYVIDAATGGALDEVTLSVLADVFGG